MEKMEKTITVNELFTLGTLLAKAKELNRKDFKYNYCLNKNLKTVQEAVKLVQESLPIEPVNDVTGEVKKAYNEEIANITKSNTEIKIYTYKCNEFFADANADETDLYMDYLEDVKPIKED